MRKTIIGLTILLSALFLASCIETIVPDDVTGIDLNFEPQEAYMVSDPDYPLSGKTVTVYFADKDPETFNATDERIQITGDVVGSGQSLALDTSTVGSKTASFSFGEVSVSVGFYVAHAVINKASLVGDSITAIINGLDDGASLVDQRVVYIEPGTYQGSELGDNNEVNINNTNNLLITTNSQSPATLINTDDTYYTVFDITSTGVTIENFTIVRRGGTTSTQAVAIRNSHTTLRNTTIQGSEVWDEAFGWVAYGITIQHGWPGDTVAGDYNRVVEDINIIDNVIVGKFSALIVISLRMDVPLENYQGELSDITISGNEFTGGLWAAIQTQFGNWTSPVSGMNPIDNLVIEDNSFAHLQGLPYLFITSELLSSVTMTQSDLDKHIDLATILTNNTFDQPSEWNIIVDETYSDEENSTRAILPTSNPFEWEFGEEYDYPAE
jgi:hypothetical protein